MLSSFGDSLSKLKSSSVQVSEFTVYTYAGMAGVLLIFAEGTTLQVGYWRSVKNGKERISSFDHRQKYGLPPALEAIAELQKELRGKTVSGAQIRQRNGRPQSSIH